MESTGSATAEGEVRKSPTPQRQQQKLVKQEFVVQEEQLINPQTHPIDDILRLANNQIGLDSRDNLLQARKGDSPISLSYLIQQTARNMGGNVYNILMVRHSELKALLIESDRFRRERDEARAERDQARADLGDLQARYNEEYNHNAEAEAEIETKDGGIG